MLLFSLNLFKSFQQKPHYDDDSDDIDDDVVVGSEAALLSSPLTPGLGLALVILSVLVYPSPR